MLEILHPEWFDDVRIFPEKAFKCKANCDIYDERVLKGYTVMKNTKIVFSGLCINIADKIQSLIMRMKYIGHFFKDYRVVIFENDSSDGIDLDIKGPISMHGLANSFGFYDEWDTISAYGINGTSLTAGFTFYYDFIAYKDNRYDINNKKMDVIPLILKTNKYGVGDAPFKVKSGFAGLALYKMYIINAGVDYTPYDGNYVCEHVSFNANIIRAGFKNVYIIQACSC